MRIAIFGGTFDPIHNAHLIVAREAARQFALDQVLLVPAARPPHKHSRVEEFEHRLNMIRIACDADPVLIPSAIEANTTVSYSVRTIEKLSAALQPGDWLSFIIGADAFSEITTWYEWETVVQLVDFLVVSRPGHQYSIPAGARVRRLDSLCLITSSSEIRHELASGAEPAEVPPAVLKYIRAHGLYAKINPDT